MRRRELLVAGSAATFALCAPALRAQEEELPDPEDVLRTLIGIEQASVVSYEALSSADFLDRTTADTARLFRDHEREQLEALVTALEDMGGERPESPTRAEVAGLEVLRDQRQALRFALDLERRSVAGYVEAAGQIEDATLIKTLATIAGSEGQHLAILRAKLGRAPVPNAFERG